jgi:Flp pilus assembly protein TadG
MKHGRRPGPGRAQRGVATVVFVIIVPVLLGFVGVAIDLARTYARNTQLKAMADQLALAAASRLDGTVNGIKGARTAAIDVQNRSAWGQGTSSVWNNNAISFASDPNATTWTSYADAILDPSRLFYVKVDVAKLDTADDTTGPLGEVKLTLSKILPGITQNAWELSSVQAVAGKLTSPVTPLAVCAPNPKDTAKPPTWGFPGTPFNLLGFQLRLVNPVDATPTDPGNTGDYDSTGHFGATYMKAFLCSGTAAVGQLANRAVYLMTGTLPSDLDTYKQNTDLDIATWLSARWGLPGCAVTPPPPAAAPVMNLAVLDCSTVAADPKQPAYGRGNVVAVGRFTLNAPITDPKNIPVTFYPGTTDVAGPTVLFK